MMHATVRVKDFEEALAILDRLEVLRVGDVLVRFAVQVSPWQIVRDVFEAYLEQFRLLVILGSRLVNVNTMRRGPP